MGILEESLRLFVYLSESIGFNLAFPLFFSAPFILFIAQPSSTIKLRIATTLAAILMAYFLINLAIHTRYEMTWNAYEACQSQFSDGSIQHHDACGNIHVANGLPLFLYLVVGWILGGAYVGIWELIWRRVYRRYLREHGVPRWFWVTSIPTWLLYLVLSYPVIAIVGALTSYWGHWSELFQK